MGQRKIATTPVFQKLEAAYKSGLYNVFVLEGGSRSSKTYSIIQFWIKYAQEHQDRVRRVIIARLKATWITSTVAKDFFDVLKDYGLYDKKNHNKSVGAGVYTLFTTEFWFLGLDDEQRIHGMKSDAFWINEAVESSFDDYAQLMQRCSGFAVLDYNPSYDEHWIYDKICKREKTRYMHSTMLDNPLIPDNAKEQILSYEPTEYNIQQGTADKRKWQIYGLGKRASLEGLIYSNWNYCKEMPQGLPKRGYGVDYGFTNDFTAVVDCAFVGNCLYLDEVCYKTHMESKDIIKLFKSIPPQKIMSESADPRLVNEIRNSGARIYPVSKGQGSIEASISVIQGYRIFVTERSLNLIKELKNYTWAFDEKTKKFINKPADGQADHLLDAFRYWVMGELMGRIKEVRDYSNVFTH
jgi:phage terminase large subunit